LEHLAKSLPLSVTRLPFNANGAVDERHYRDSMTEKTRLMILTHGSNVLGSVQPLRAFIELAKTTGIPLLVDAAQTAGRVPIDLNDAPVFLACSAHKALLGFPGTGILTVPPGIDVRKWREGGSGSTSESLDHPEDLPMRLEAGTPNFAGIPSLFFGIKFIGDTGIQKIHEQEMALAERIRTFLQADDRFTLYSADPELAVLAFNLRTVPPEDLSLILDHEFGIAVRSGLHCAAVLHSQLGTLPSGCVRISPGYFNTASEIDTLIASLQKIAEAY
jgi:selenocysteine lyase/cysteine desulfurase